MIHLESKAGRMMRKMMRNAENMIVRMTDGMIPWMTRMTEMIEARGVHCPQQCPLFCTGYLCKWLPVPYSLTLWPLLPLWIPVTSVWPLVCPVKANIDAYHREFTWNSFISPLSLSLFRSHSLSLWHQMSISCFDDPNAGSYPSIRSHGSLPELPVLQVIIVSISAN